MLAAGRPVPAAGDPMKRGEGMTIYIYSTFQSGNNGMKSS